MPNEALSGAASGAATGASVAGPWGAVIGAGVGAISGFMSGRRRKKEAQKERRRQERIRMKASPQHLMEVVKTLQPLMREIVASGLGPQFQTAVADSIAKHGMTGTGVGEAMRSSAASAPAIFATQAATEKASGVVKNELAAEGIAGPEPSAGQNPLLDALMGGARGFMAGGGGARRADPFSRVNEPITGGRSFSDDLPTNMPNIFPSSPGAMVSDASGTRFEPRS